MRTESGMNSAGLVRTLRTLRDPLLLAAAPITFAVLLGVVGYGNSWSIGFDFRGTLWEPARAALDGVPMYPTATPEAVAVGNPAVYPPVFILLSVPLALLSAAAASWLWLCVLGAASFASMWILGVRDWRCLVLVVTSPVVVHGLWFGNLTLLLLVALALAWRYRNRAWVVGIAIGTAVAAKLFVWPLVVWLLLTRRFRAAAWAVSSAIVLVSGAWALVGFDGLREYPKLLHVVQDVYAERSFSVATAAGALGASVPVGVVLAAIAGLLCVGAAAWLLTRDDGDRRAFAALVAACVVASPIVWPNYAALLFVPIAVTWPRLAPAWFFGYVVWLTGALSPKPTAPEAGPRPPGVSDQAWLWSHAEPVFWFAAGLIATVVGVAVLMGVAPRQQSS